MSQQGTPVSGVIEDAKVSGSGKSLGIKVNGKWYSTKEFHWQGQIGQQVSFMGNYQSFGDGGITWANDIVLTNAPGPNSMAPPPQPSAPSPQAQGYAPPANYSGASQTSAPASGRDRDASIIAQALTKAITKPGDSVATVWKNYSELYFLAVRGEKQAAGAAAPPPPNDDFDDDIPF